ncbi:MAG TPA: helix-turn-helix domain-containing protein [Candidatus Saccharimonadales bacterium]|nr:helix-turn-helix domain-containing protein [Candidatus Saccharimonadales bacterium]
MKTFRSSDSPYILGVTKRLYKDNTGDVTLPDGCWDLLVVKQDEQIQIILTGAITRPVPLDFGAGTEVMNITFRPDMFHPIPASQMLNEGKVLPLLGKHSFVFDNAVLEIPTFDNAEEFVAKMLRLGLLQSDKLVASVLDGKPMAASERSVQRHFLQTTGMTMKFVRQVERAQLAVEMLRQGKRIIDVAHELGFTDQAHMTKSLKGIMGLRPSEIIKAK